MRIVSIKVTTYNPPLEPGMGLPRLRFTVRRISVVVAVIALALGGYRWGEERRQSFAILAHNHYKITLLSLDLAVAERLGQPPPSQEAARLIRAQVARSRLLAEKYEHAARYPWLPVAPDPPEPK